MKSLFSLRKLADFDDVVALLHKLRPLISFKQNYNDAVLASSFVRYETESKHERNLIVGKFDSANIFFRNRFSKMALAKCTAPEKFCSKDFHRKVSKICIVAIKDKGS